MEAVTILRELWRRRALVAAVAIVSAFIGLAIAYTISFPPHSRKFEVAIASGRILVDTPDSQVVDVHPRGSETLGIRAGVVANLMTQGDVKAAIARRAGLRPNQLRAGLRVGGELPPVLSDAAGDPNAHLLITNPATNPDGTPLPMIDIEAQAPVPRDAARLATAAVTGLNDYLDTKASGEGVPDVKRLQLTGLGPPEVHEEARGPSGMLAAAVATFVFLLGCAAILVASPLARAWRVAARIEDEERAATPPSTTTPPNTKERRDWRTRVAALGSQAARARAQARPGESTAPKKLLPVAESASATAQVDEEPTRDGDEVVANYDEAAANGDEPAPNSGGQVAEAGSAATISS